RDAGRQHRRASRRRRAARGEPGDAAALRRCRVNIEGGAHVRHVVICLSFVVGTVAGLGALAHQGAAKPASLRACQLLTKELALKVTATTNKKIFDILPPEEESLGAKGSACEYGDIRLQVDPFTAQSF